MRSPRLPALLPVCALLTLLAAMPLHAGVRASLDADEVSSGENVHLTIEHDGQVRSQPDLSPLQQDFDVLGSNYGSSLRIDNGRMSSSTQLQLTLSPRHAGRIVIPPLTWAGERTAPLTLTVSDGGGSQAATGGSSKIFIQTEVDPPRPYVLSAVHLTVRLYQAMQLYRETLELPANDAVVTREVGKATAERVERNGVPYIVTTRHYLLFPQKSGPLTLEGATLDALVSTNTGGDPFDPFGVFSHAGRPIRVHGDPIKLDVQPRPAATAAAPYWLPARHVSLEANWQPQSLEVHAGEPISVNLALRAEDLTAAQLPDLSTQLAIPGALRSYPEQPKLNDTDQGGGVTGSREQTLTLIADSAGTYHIPALTVTWWDTQAGQLRQATVPERTLTVLPAVGAAAPQGSQTAPAVPAAVTSAADAGKATAATVPGAAPRAPGNAGPWQLASAVLLTLWVGTAAAWAWTWSRRRPAASSAVNVSPPEPAPASQQRRAFRAACEHNDARQARASLLAWAAQVYGSHAPAGLGALGRQLSDPALTPLLAELDRACFAQATEAAWNGAPLLATLKDLPVQKAAAGHATGLAPLYPLH